jgi:hypothetical protein
MYGPDADKLFEAVRPILESEPALIDMGATLRYGPPEEGVKEVQIAITRSKNHQEHTIKV